MIDLTELVTADEIFFYSDASAAKKLGFGCILNQSWIFRQWESQFIEKQSPSIGFLELYALCAGLLTWENAPVLNNCRIVIFCDNQAVVAMINNISSSCAKCMGLLRILVLNGMRHKRLVCLHDLYTRKVITWQMR